MRAIGINDTLCL